MVSNVCVQKRNIRGGGIGSILLRLVRGMKPIYNQVKSTGAKILKTRTAQELLEEAGKAAVEASLRIADSALAGENIINSGKHNAADFGKRMLDKTKTILHNNIGNTIEKKKRYKRREKKTEANENNFIKKADVKKSNDIFDEVYDPPSKKRKK